MRRWHFPLSVAALALGVLGGCASQLTGAPQHAASPPQMEALHNISLRVADNARVQVAEGVEFDSDELESRLRLHLGSADLVANDSDFDLDVQVTDVRLRSTWNEVMFGVMAGADHILGRVIVLDRAGREVYSFDANASYALGGFPGGLSTRLAWLYNRFSEVVTEQLVATRDEAMAGYS